MPAEVGQAMARAVETINVAPEPDGVNGSPLSPPLLGGGESGELGSGVLEWSGSCWIGGSQSSSVLHGV